jgi:hypothetical protein
MSYLSDLEAIAEQQGRSLSKCPKLKQGQLLMQRYHFVASRGGDKYAEQAERCARKIPRLEKRMIAHAEECPRCGVDDENFFGMDLEV